jgi:hypothetical protein
MIKEEALKASVHRRCLFGQTTPENQVVLRMDGSIITVEQRYRILGSVNLQDLT